MIWVREDSPSPWPQLVRLVCFRAGKWVWLFAGEWDVEEGNLI